MIKNNCTTQLNTPKGWFEFRKKNLEILIKSFHLDNFQHQNMLVLLSFTQHHQVNNFAIRKYIL